MQTTTQTKGIREMQTTIMQRKTDHPLGMALLVLIAVLAAALMMNIAADRASATEAAPTLEQPPEPTGDSSVLEELPQAPPAKDTRYLLSQGKTHEQYLYDVKQNIDNFWARSFASAGKPYRYATLRLIYNNVYMKCTPGVATLSAAPMYCPADQTVYWAPLKRDWQNGLRIDQYGDFAVAYMMGHEMGHHVQNWSGIQLTQPYQELQADCLSGVWANSQYYKGYMEPGDIQEALNLAWAWGGSASHGTKDQRHRAFKLGYNTGNTGYCTPYYLRSFALTEDNTEPEITGLRPAGKTSDRTPAVRAVVRDASGELAKNQVKLYLDGKQVSTASYDQETGKLSHVSGKLDFGKHTVKVVATDLGENTATEKWSFKVVK